MKSKKIFFLIFILAQIFVLNSFGQDKKIFEGPRWRVGLNIQYSTSFKNIKIDYPGLGYTGILGGFSGKGLSIYGGYKLHKYVSLDVETGLLLNSYNRGYSNGILIIGRFNKFYVHPAVKFIYPVANWGDGRVINAFIGAGIGLNASGRFYLENNYGSNVAKDVVYARVDPMVAPFAVFGAELLLSDRTNIVVGFKYQNGSFHSNYYYNSLDATANIKNAPAEIKRINAQGLGFSIGVIQEF